MHKIAVIQAIEDIDSEIQCITKTIEEQKEQEEMELRKISSGLSVLHAYLKGKNPDARPQ